MKEKNAMTELVKIKEAIIDDYKCRIELLWIITYLGFGCIMGIVIALQFPNFNMSFWKYPISFLACVSLFAFLGVYLSRKKLLELGCYD